MYQKSATKQSENLGDRPFSLQKSISMKISQLWGKEYSH
jgi:hypothetical protein